MLCLSIFNEIRIFCAVLVVLNGFNRLLSVKAIIAFVWLKYGIGDFVSRFPTCPGSPSDYLLLSFLG
jgi:hypothetical protein